MKKIAIIILAAGCMAGCLNNRRATVPHDEQQVIGQDVTEVGDPDSGAFADGHTAQNSLDYAGTYRGVLPCADCEGIENILTLNDDGTYDLSTKYLGKGDDHVYTSSGSYSWEDDGKRIRLSGDPGYRYFVGENLLWQLDLEGNRVTGSLADHYKLEKQ